MSDSTSSSVNCNRRTALKGSLLAIVILLAIQVTSNMTFQSLAFPNIYKRMSSLMLYSQNISQEVQQIIEKINSTVHSRQNANKTYVEATTSLLPMCPEVPPKLVGPLATYKESPPMEDLEKLYSWLLPGGCYVPIECSTKHRVAVVIPYRNREKQLRTFLYNIHPFLQRQQIEYGIYVVEQSGDNKFNRALLMNIGFAESIKIKDYNCFVFHDVDLIPEDDRNFYGCGEQPRHLSAAIDKFQYRLPYAAIFGGVSQISREAFEKINGFSNLYFGWGGEDDDMCARVKDGGYKIQRYSLNIARYKMIKHHHEKNNQANPQRFHLLQTAKKRFKTDGINSLKYKVLKIDNKKLYTLVSVEVNEKDFSKS